MSYKPRTVSVFATQFCGTCCYKPVTTSPLIFLAHAYHVEFKSEGCFIFFPDCTLNRYYIDKSQCFFTFMDGKWDMACI